MEVDTTPTTTPTDNNRVMETGMDTESAEDVDTCTTDADASVQKPAIML